MKAAGRKLALLLALSLILSLSCVPVSQAAGNGNFQVVNGKIYDPNGNRYVASGLDMYLSDGTADQVLAMFPGINFIRIPDDSTHDPSYFSSFINTMTAHGVVCEIEYHPWPTFDTSSEPSNYLSWINSLANYYKSNPYVWIGTMNEPTNAALTNEHTAVYNQVRGTGNNNIVVLYTEGANAQTPSSYASMHGVVWDSHFYGWLSDYSTNVSDVRNAYLYGTKWIGGVSNAQFGSTYYAGTVSADGAIPLINGEFGPSTDDLSTDANANQVIDTVSNWAIANGYSQGYSGWSWWRPGNGMDNVQNSGVLTTWGTQLKNAIQATKTWLSSQPGLGSSNTLANTGFESGLSSWGTWGSTSAAAGNANSGSYAVKVPSGGGVYQDINASAGAIYNLSAFGKADAGGGSGAIYIKAKNASGTDIAGSEVDLNITSSSYSKKTTTYVAPAGTAKLEVGAWTSSGTIYCDDYSLTLNLLANPGFESGLTSWGSWGSVSAVTGNANSGSYSAKVTNGSGVFEQINAAAGNTYHLSAYGKTDASGGSGAIYIKAKNASGADIAGSEVDLNITSSSYSQKTTTYVAPAGTAKLEIGAWTSSGTIYCDDYSVN
ncbi:hypothetical protein GXP70_07390 [Paenibacillus lycopersici]|uniref:Glycoside hydrolase family 5 domain-containing protein n=1 Tax=Paenibacillus lycopersici TaxID=2704462 RepID=A0A6C0FWX3_9BACL|nr:cellulase family glycosylhydrolase [Paenibacillus lycopersici]QHT59794.1 hypothetical protein GXP70_07390 [Paenibacillus lycopersici]